MSLVLMANSVYSRSNQVFGVNGHLPYTFSSPIDAAAVRGTPAAVDAAVHAECDTFGGTGVALPNGLNL